MPAPLEQGGKVRGRLEWHPKAIPPAASGPIAVTAPFAASPPSSRSVGTRRSGSCPPNACVLRRRVPPCLCKAPSQGARQVGARRLPRRPQALHRRLQLDEALTLRRRRRAQPIARSQEAGVPATLGQGLRPRGRRRLLLLLEATVQRLQCVIVEAGQLLQALPVLGAVRGLGRLAVQRLLDQETL